MKNKDLYNARNSLVKYLDVKENNSFSYAIYKNIELIDVILKSFDRLNEVPMEISRYEVERRSICEKYAKRDEDGGFEVENEQYVIENREEFDKEMNELEEKYKDIIEKRKKDLENIEILMESNCELKFIKTDMQDLPKLSPSEMMNLSFMIK
jgi:hypothetical protein